MVVEAEGLPIGRLLPFHTTPLVSYETNLGKDKEMVGQFHDKARTDAEIVVIAMNRPAPLFFVKLSLSAEIYYFCRTNLGTENYAANLRFEP